MTDEVESPATIVLCAGGPALIRGPVTVEDADGVRHESSRPVSALCRCGCTSRAPWCDGTHKRLPPGSRP